jgi:NTP pyrophosphatase (non-canonical NTP hydrolase)
MARITDDERARFHALLDECIDKLNTPKNAAKQHWSTQFYDQLFEHLVKETIELHTEILFMDRHNIEDECKDVVNIALMIFDNVRGNKHG